MFKVQVEIQPDSHPTEWDTLLGEYPTKKAARRAVDEHQRTPGGYARQHRILGPDGRDVDAHIYE